MSMNSNRTRSEKRQLLTKNENAFTIRSLRDGGGLGGVRAPTAFGVARAYRSGFTLRGPRKTGRTLQMRTALRSLFFGIAGTALFAGAASATDLTIECRCVIGGVSSAGAEWITKSVIPAFTAKMKADGKDVTVTLNQFGGEDAQLSQQQALDFSTGAGPDVAAFDGFLIPSFAEGGLLKPLDEVAGKAVDDWDGWSHISDGIQSIMSYKGKVYGIPNGTDVRMIFTRKDMLDEGRHRRRHLPAEVMERAARRRARRQEGLSRQLPASARRGRFDG